MIKAGSLLYAVYICLLISVISGSLIFIFNYNLDFSTRQAVQSDLIDLCDSCFDYYLADAQNFDSVNSEKLDLFDNGQVCEFTKSKWGFYTILSVKAYFKKDTIQKSAFVGEQHDEKLALFLCDWDEQLKVSGLTNINGDMKLPASGHKTVNILGNNQLNKPVLFGQITKSAQTLPEISISKVEETNSNAKTTGLSKLNRKSLIYNDFRNEVLVVELDKGEQLDNMSLKGNIVIKSIDTLYINSSTKLEDVIIQAPKVIIRNGFVGRAQFVAEIEIFIESRVLLKYPSSVAVLSGKSLMQKKIMVSKNSKIYGSVVMDAATFDEKENNKVVVEEGAFIMGNLYCNGKLQLQGKVLGTVHTHKLELETKSGKYENILLNSSIDALNVPKGFIKLPLFKKQENQTYGIVKTL